MDALVLCALSDRARLPCLHAETYAITNHKRCPFLGIRLFDNTTLTLFRSPTQTRHAVDSRRDTPASGKPRDDGTACFQPVARRKRHSRRGEWASECHRLEGLEGLTCLVEYCQLETTNLEGTLIYFEWRLHFKLDLATDSHSAGNWLHSEGMARWRRWRWPSCGRPTSGWMDGRTRQKRDVGGRGRACD